MEERDPTRPTEAPGAAAFFWLSIVAMFVIPVTLMAMAAD